MLRVERGWNQTPLILQILVSSLANLIYVVCVCVCSQRAAGHGRAGLRRDVPGETPPAPV